jgi:hypothetical protein
VRGKERIQKWIEAYRSDKIVEGHLLNLLVTTIPEVSIEEILSFLDKGQKEKFLMNLVAISKPDWVSLDGWEPSAEALTMMRKFLQTMGKSSTAWNKL